MNSFEGMKDGGKQRRGYLIVWDEEWRGVWGGVYTERYYAWKERERKWEMVSFECNGGGEGGRCLCGAVKLF